ncbi:MAG: site-specific integrase [Bdellovibrionales bacterium]|nr:site-specific integrase [Bdellovibrionales bacterium]
MNSESIQYFIKSFMGYLEGTGKSSHTIRNYGIDLQAFQNYIDALTPKRILMTQILPEDVLQYSDYLKAQGLKTNTRRRRVLTLRKWLRYLKSRGKIGFDLADQIPAPGKLERVPKRISRSELLQKIDALPDDEPIHGRNRALLRTLAETGCLVSELVQLRFEDFKKGSVRFLGKRERTVAISDRLFSEVQGLKKFYTSASHCFLSYGKSRFTQIPLTARAVELLFRQLEPAILPGFDSRTFRQAVILDWMSDGISEQEIQKRLGLKSKYAFRVYFPLRSKTEATSSA